jgi:hypothetical protein
MPDAPLIPTIILSAIVFYFPLRGLLYQYAGALSPFKLIFNIFLVKVGQ